jgi:hypothetical protein
MSVKLLLCVLEKYGHGYKIKSVFTLQFGDGQQTVVIRHTEFKGKWIVNITPSIFVPHVWKLHSCSVKLCITHL